MLSPGSRADATNGTETSRLMALKFGVKLINHEKISPKMNQNDKQGASAMCFHFMSLQIAAAGFKHWPLTDSSIIVLECQLCLTPAWRANCTGGCRKPSTSTIGFAHEDTSPGQNFPS